MKRVLMVLVLMAGFGLSYAVEVKFNSLTWIDWSYSFDDSFSLTTNATGDSKTGNMGFSRNYNDFKVNWNDTVKGRVTLDFGKLTAPLKYAWIDWKIASPLVITIGLQKTFFGYTPEWKYELPVKALADQVGTSSSADFGIGIGGSVLDKKISYNMQILNGQGYNGNETGVKDDYALGINAVVAPAKDIKVGLSFRLAEKNGLDFTGKKYLNNALAAYVDAKFGNLWALAEFVGEMPDTGLETDLQFTVGYKISETFAAYANFLNQYETSTNSTQRITVALNYIPAKSVVLKPFANINLDGGLDTIDLGVQTEISFDFKVGSVDKKEEKTE